MDNFSAQLNDLLVGAYHSIGKLEELSLKSVKSVDLSISELHLLEAIGKTMRRAIPSASWPRIWELPCRR